MVKLPPSSGFYVNFCHMTGATSVSSRMFQGEQLKSYLPPRIQIHVTDTARFEIILVVSLLRAATSERKAYFVLF
jgi:hypothetical protein